MEYRQTWKQKATPSDRLYWAHTASARRTSDSGCTGWQTPTSGDAGRAGNLKDYINYVENGQTSGCRLRAQAYAARLSGWPTPNAMQGGSTSRGGDRKDELLIGGLVQGLSGWNTPRATDGTNGGPNARDSSGAPHLSAQVMFPTPYGLSANPGQGDGEFGKAIRQSVMFPPPTSADASRGADARDREGSGGPNLLHAAKTWPMPQSRDWKSGSTVSDYGNSRPLSEHVSGQLSPTWVEWLMGFPLGWTDLDASATP
jgi:hypothetical protein